jgi:hypothetical protein
MKKVIMLGVMLFTTSIGFAMHLYTYKCPACGLVQQYKIPGVYKCSTDGWTMVPCIR